MRIPVFLGECAAPPPVSSGPLLGRAPFDGARCSLPFGRSFLSGSRGGRVPHVPRLLEKTDRERPWRGHLPPQAVEVRGCGGLGRLGGMGLLRGRRRLRRSWARDPQREEQAERDGQGRGAMPHGFCPGVGAGCVPDSVPLGGGYRESQSEPSTTVHGSPAVASLARNGSGSNCSMLNTPAPRHFSVSIIFAPTIAGTPVV